MGGVTTIVNNPSD